MYSIPKDKVSYLLRLWRNASLSDPTWHASLENPMTGERKGFNDIDELMNFLKTHILTSNEGTKSTDETGPVKEE